jgi:ectoine hydroxylase-related dioxygenase (phytanoyl-CoA dioxygenase family)
MNGDFANHGNALFLGDKDYPDYEDRIEQLIAAEKLEKKTFLAKKGDVFIWHANLLHGGNPMNQPELTRKSMVFHYYTKDAICYHELTQRPSLKG